MQVLLWDKQTQKKVKRDFGTHFDKNVFKKVNRILSEVRQRGDLALRRYTREFDGIDLPLKRLRVVEGDINRAYEKIQVKFVPMLKQISENVKEYYEKELKASFSVKGKDGIYLAKRYQPLERVGVYIPGGTAPLVSTVYMTVIPAKVAGVKEIVMATPPNRDTGEIDPHMLVVANLLGVNEIYRIGGAQAIGALAFGTRTIQKVDKIVGPGNQYVTEAKRQVYGFVDIDMVAGPSEVAIIADASADPDFVTCDLLAQAEHYGGISYLVTPSKKLIDIVRKRVDGGFIIQVKSLQEACEVVNEIAPEHLEIVTESPESLLNDIKHAGAIFLGPYTPAVIGDYIAGPSHVLPTGGTARYYSPLSASSFIKSSQVISYSKEALLKVKEHVQKLADMEGLVLHRISMEARFVEKREPAPQTKV
ncbi:MAG: histidinol dehydrogenase [Candidatus Omnitrophica bacterium]|nr:histidinol dehydrogenase [Candidatus Omnitrophota bacterium]MDD5671815.1 histidinol dehydrogenase [Candidatus Omnitrophota bacterium]